MSRPVSGPVSPARERKRARDREYYQKNKAKELARREEHRTKNGRVTTEKEKEGARRRAKKWREEHLEEARANDRDYYQFNRERLLTYSSQYWKDAPEEQLEKRRERQRRYYKRKQRTKKLIEQQIAREMDIFEKKEVVKKRVLTAPTRSGTIVGMEKEVLDG